MKDPDIVFSWCAFFSVVMGSFLAFILTIHFYPVSSTRLNSALLAGLCHLALLAIFVSLLVYASDKVIPNPRRKS